jgi:hypothetical protein
MAGRRALGGGQGRRWPRRWILGMEAGQSRPEPCTPVRSAGAGHPPAAGPGCRTFWAGRRGDRRRRWRQQRRRRWREWRCRRRRALDARYRNQERLQILCGCGSKAYDTWTQKATAARFGGVGRQGPLGLIASLNVGWFANSRWQWRPSAQAIIRKAACCAARWAAPAVNGDCDNRGHPGMHPRGRVRSYCSWKCVQLVPLYGPPSPAPTATHRRHWWCAAVVLPSRGHTFAATSTPWPKRTHHTAHLCTIKRDDIQSRTP